jgi:hypothetical protein
MAVRPQNYLDSFFARVADCFTPDVAKRVLGVKVDADVRAWAQEMAEKANEGTLSEAERAEYEEYIEVVDLIGILQAKARQMLARHGS